MATMVLKDTVKCECGKEMFVWALDKENRRITYKCSDPNCTKTVEMSFDEAKLPENEKSGYFCLNDDGDMTWKCYNHGYCDFNVEWFSDDWQDKVNRFTELGCALESYMEEIEAELGNTDGHIEELQEMFSHLEEEQIEEIASEMGVMVEEDIYSAFCSDFEECMLDGVYDSWDEYKEAIISTMYDLDMCLDE